MAAPRSKSRLAILGSWPPPTGGVSIHTRRLCALLAERDIDYVVYNATSDVGDGERVIGVYSKRRIWLLKYLFNAREDAVYLLSGRLSAWIIGALMAIFRGKRVMIRLRNVGLIDWISKSRIKRMLCAFALKRMDTVICVNEALGRAAVELGVDPSRVHWAPGFLPPCKDDLRRDDVADAVWTFVDKHTPIIAANGKVDEYNGADLYGLDHMVELSARLKDDFPSHGIVVCFWEHRPEEQARLDVLLARARELGVADNILFNTQPGPFVPVMEAADILVRPTNTDGDANSIREAIYLGIPAVASDVVTRPQSARVFPTRNLDAFERQVRSALAESMGQQREPVSIPPDDQERIARYLDRVAAFATGSDIPTVSATTA